MTEEYRRRAAQQALLRDAESRKSATVARLRLATFLVGAACLVFASGGHGDPLFAAGAGSFALFAALVLVHNRVEAGVAWHEALRVVNERAIARIERRWDDLPSGHAPATLDVTRHRYAADLDLFGRASLFQLLGPAATAPGNETLARWLLEAAGREQILARHDATTELAPLLEWRLEFAAHGQLAHGTGRANIAGLLAWAEGPAVFPRIGVLQAAVAVLAGSMWLLLGLFAAGVVGGALFAIPLLAGIVLSFSLGSRIQDAFDRAGSGERALARYAALLAQASGFRFTAPLLGDIQARLGTDGASAPRCMRQLTRMLGFAELRRGAAILHAPIQALTLWDFFVLFALERWRRRAGARVRAWVQALAELDALAVLAALRHDHPDWALPEFVEESIYSGEALGHPLLAEAHRVPNDVAVGPPGSLLLVTGSNMSGKSTLLRAIGLNAVLAHAGGCVCAARLRTPEIALHTSIRVQDSLELGLSYFMAALARLKAVVDAANASRGSRLVLYLLDEILQGTNSVERGIAVRAVAQHLLDAGAIGAVTTHDLSLAEEEPLKSCARLVHFTETVDAQGVMSFDYRLRPGLATSRNALRLMQMIGIEVPNL